ncbi:MAG: cytochrome b5-like heme/steroid binding domain-containing protein [bacterium]|nr:cytochrome b5-like heme/steroid binding domain-containing protein [bacterium]
MKKSLLISFVVFWILTTAIITSTLAKAGNKKINSTGLNSVNSLPAVSNHLPVANAAGPGSGLEQAGLSSAAAGGKAADTPKQTGGKAQQSAYQAAISHPGSQSQKTSAANNSRSQAKPAASNNSQAQTGQSSLNNNQTPAGSLTITLAQLASHNSAASCWSVINGGVYDLTSLASSHSGGAAAILRACGLDGTSIFNSQAHSAYAVNALNAYFIGNLSAASPPPPPAPAPAPTPSPAPAPDPAPTPPPAPAPTPPPPRNRHNDDDDDD